ncbi:MAG: hypothetical protein BGO26_16705 [Actinobacteria bacterium 69-20]|nr:hypothetical protein [Actinomycetota bacterium]OJV27113.1 MAG: hypothetical protein BGO26_16705 [Actinobacteria bacterium 69-20]
MLGERGVVNGVPTEIQAGDHQTFVVRIKCWCGSPVGIVRYLDRSVRGLPPLYFAAVQVIRDRAARPVRTTMIRRRVDGADLHAACPAHGVQTADGAAILRLARDMVQRLTLDKVTAGESRVAQYVIPRVAPIVRTRPVES